MQRIFSGKNRFGIFEISQHCLSGNTWLLGRGCHHVFVPMICRNSWVPQNIIFIILHWDAMTWSVVVMK